MAAIFLTRIAFPGVPNRNPTPKLRHLPRASGVGVIEYVALIKPTTEQLIFVCHGQMRALDQRSVQQWEDLATVHNVSVVLHNYPGYGGTTGPVTRELVCSDSLELIHSIMEGPGAGQELVLLGNSMGCGPTMYLATAGLGVTKVILISPYTSICTMMAYVIVSLLFKSMHIRMPKFLREWLQNPNRMHALQGKPNWDPFAPIKLARQLQPGTDVLILHGEADSTIPITHGMALNKEILSMPDLFVRLCVIPETEHKDTRIRGNDIIWSFLADPKGPRIERILSSLGHIGGNIKDNPVGAD